VSIVVGVDVTATMAASDNIPITLAHLVDVGAIDVHLEAPLSNMALPLLEQATDAQVLLQLAIALNPLRTTLRVEGVRHGHRQLAVAAGWVNHHDFLHCLRVRSLHGHGFLCHFSKVACKAYDSKNFVLLQ
jgi:hypothetical protein